MRPLRPISARALPDPSRDIGQRCKLMYLPIDALVVDERYQRAIAHNGHRNILAILAGFRWAKFIPVIVTPIGNGKYAIIDGQHRATAALMHPSISEVPCMVIEDITPEEAADCFAAINGRVTPISAQHIYHARLVAGDVTARAVKAACDEAGVTVIRYKMPGQEYMAGETLAVGTLEHCYRKYGHKTLVMAMRAIRDSGDGNPGCLTAALISALCQLLASVGSWRDAGDKLIAAFNEVALIDLISSAAAESKRTRRPQREILLKRLADYLSTRMLASQAQEMRAIASPRLKVVTG